jgi:S-methylmethionine-dependent homocysteine/selenocysteine methylase
MTKLLPHNTDSLFITDGGLETTLVFHEGIALPGFAAFALLKNAAGFAVLERYYRSYLDLAVRYRTGFILESPTWRANPDWAAKLGYSPADLVNANRDALSMMHRLREEYERPATPVVISGGVGPRGDGYQPGQLMTAAEAAAYHGPQIRTYFDSGADIISAITMNYVEEAIGLSASRRPSSGMLKPDLISSIFGRSCLKRPSIRPSIRKRYPSRLNRELIATSDWYRGSSFSLFF